MIRATRNLHAALLPAQFLPHVKRGTAANQRGGRRPVMQTKHYARYDCRDTRDLGHFADENQFCIRHFFLRAQRYIETAMSLLK